MVTSQDALLKPPHISNAIGCSGSSSEFELVTNTTSLEIEDGLMGANLNNGITVGLSFSCLCRFFRATLLLFLNHVCFVTPPPQVHYRIIATTLSGTYIARSLDTAWENEGDWWKFLLFFLTSGGIMAAAAVFYLRRPKTVVCWALFSPSFLTITL